MAVPRRALRLGVVAAMCCLCLGIATLSDATWAGGTSVATTHPPSNPGDIAPLVLSSLGPAYAVVTQGPLVASDFASYSPNPRAAAVALHQLSTESGFRTYLRAWSSSNAQSGVIDLVIRFPNDQAATRYLVAQRKTMTSTPYVRRAAVTSVPGATRFSYLVNQPQAGVGQFIDFADGRYVSTLTFKFSDKSAQRCDRITVGQRQSSGPVSTSRISAKPLSEVRQLAEWSSRAASTALGLAPVALVALGFVALGVRRQRKSPGGALSEGQVTSAAN